MQDDGTPDAIALATCIVAAGARLRDDDAFDLTACIPIAWWRVSDGLVHTYSVRVDTDDTATAQAVQICALFVNNVPA